MGVQLLVYTENRRGEKTQPWGDPVLKVRESETCVPSITCCLLLDRKSVMGNGSSGVPLSFKVTVLIWVIVQAGVIDGFGGAIG